MAEILKAQNVNFNDKESFLIDVTAATIQTSNHQDKCLQGNPQTVSAEIIETTEQYSLIQVTCSCGSTTIIKCKFEPTN